jgi:hypothetical protein
MKTTILIILLLPLWAVGQTDTNAIIHNNVNFKVVDADKIPPRHDFYVTIDNSELTAKDIVKLYANYKTDCFNDSILKRVHDSDKYGEGWCHVYPETPNICRESSHYGMEWVHKETSFEGFMNWLQTKTK